MNEYQVACFYWLTEYINAMNDAVHQLQLPHPQLFVISNNLCSDYHITFFIHSYTAAFYIAAATCLCYTTQEAITIIITILTSYATHSFDNCQQ